MRITQQQYDRIVGLAGGRVASVRPEPENVQQVLCAAAQVARRGRLQDAETMIASLPLTGPLGPATLDLKARLCAQQGRLVEAQLCWMEAVRQSPGNESYRQSLHYVTRTLRPSRLPLLMYTMTSATLVVMALILAYALGRMQ